MRCRCKFEICLLTPPSIAGMQVEEGEFFFGKNSLVQIKTVNYLPFKIFFAYFNAGFSNE